MPPWPRWHRHLCSGIFRWVTLDNPQTLTASLAFVTITVSVLLTYQLFALLGLTKSQRMRRGLFAALCSLFRLAIVSGWQLSPGNFLMMGTAMAILLGLVALGVAAKKALSDDRLNRALVFGICCVLIALQG